MKITRYILALALALCATGAQAQAISALPAASTLGGTEVTAVVQSATTKKATIDQIKTWASNAPTLVTPALGTPASGNFSTGTFTWPTFNQSTTGSAATLTTPRAIYGNNFDGSAALTGVIASTYGGTGNSFTKFSGPTTAERTFTLPDADATILYSGGNAGTPSALVCTNCTGTAAGLTAGNVTTNANLTGDVTSSGNATTLATVNSNVGSFTNANITVNAKGLITAAANGSGGTGTVTATGGDLTANAVVLGAGTTDTKVSTGITTDGVGTITLVPANNAAALVLSANTTGVGTLSTNGSTTVTGTSTKFLSQLTAGDSITPSGQSARTISYITSDTSLVLTSAASGTGSGLSYTIAPVTNSLNPNGSFTSSPWAAGAGTGSTRYGDGAVAAGSNSVAIGQRASAANTQGIAIGWGTTVPSGNGIAIGYQAVGGGGIAIGTSAVTSDGGNATSIAIGYQASTGSYQSIAIGRGATATADGQFIVGYNGAGAAGRITEAYFGSGRVSTGPAGFTLNGTGGSGSNVIGANVAIAGGMPTGTAAGGNVQIRTAPTLQASGSTQNTLVDRQITVAAGKALTSGAAASLVDIALPTLKMAGGNLRYNIICTDGTDMQSLSGMVVWSAVNKGASYTVSITAPDGGTANDTAAAKSVSAGTLTLSWAVTSGSDKVTIQPTATTSLTATTFRIYYTIENHSDQAITVL